MKRVIIAVVALGLLAAGVAAVNFWRHRDAYDIDWKIVEQPPKEVNWEVPQRGEIVETLTAPGTIEPIEEADIASQTVGRVIEVNVEKGDSVKEGDLLVQLDDTDIRARRDSVLAPLEVLQEAIKTSEIDREKAKRDLGRSEKLSKEYADAVSDGEMDEWQTNLERAEHTLLRCQHERAESEATLRAFDQELGWTKICAPTDGVVVDLDVEVGEIVIAGTTNLPGTVLMRIADLSRMRVRAEVDETDVLRVQSGQPARIYLQSGDREPTPGSVDRIAPTGKKEGEVVSFETLIAIEGEHAALRGGMTCTVEIEVRRSADALSVPIQAVVHRRRKDLPDTAAFRDWAEQQARSPGEKAREAEARYIKVLFIMAEGVARACPVETGLSDERRIEILSILKPGDSKPGKLSLQEHVIVGPFRALDELKDGQRVEPATATSEETP